MNKKILVIGASGLIGRAMSEALGSDRNWIGTYYKRVIPGGVKLDITDPGQVKRAFAEIMPTHVIHCAQLTGGVDFCEKNPVLAKDFHYNATINLCTECLKYKARFIFISSECVFDGKKESYVESDKPSPLSVYGRWKAESEAWIKNNLKDYIIVRSMSVYGWDPLTKTPNAVMNVYSSILKGEKIHIPVYRWGNPTHVKDLAKGILELTLSKESGIFHVVGATFINRYEWLKKTCEVLGWDSSLLLPLDQLQQDLAVRPSKINLDTQKFRDNFSTKLHTLEEGLGLLQLDMNQEMIRNA